MRRSWTRWWRCGTSRVVSHDQIHGTLHHLLAYTCRPYQGIRNSTTRFTTRPSSSPTAVACVCIARRSISAPAWPARPSELKKSTTASGSSASWITISVISIWRKKLCSPSTTPSGQKCYLCLRYILLPMSPGRTSISLAPQSGHVSNFCGPTGTVIEPINAESFSE